ncbi:phosphoribosylformylglycinamidine synthase subunit PurQ [bacterium]|nr:phosphoribosylformylglycinamidine synthase subunit PurQ [bacterium]
MRWGVVVFPGSNCDYDAFDTLGRIFEQEVRYIWHKDRDLKNIDGIILPGGFSYGDYLRSGAIARFSPVIEEVIRFANKGGIVIGICNGFQVLTEAGLLPGTLRENVNLRFICEDLYLRVENNSTRFTHLCDEGQVLKIPVAHNEGNYFAPPNVLKELEDHNRVVFRYSDRQGKVDEISNPNGSLNNIAGICNKAGNVLGMMPHPERRCDPVIGGIDGQVIFKSVITAAMEMAK